MPSARMVVNMLKVEEASCMASCDSCGKKWNKSFRKIYVAGGARYIVITFVLCGSCLKDLKEML